MKNKLLLYLLLAGGTAYAAPKVTLCHNGNTIQVSQNAVAAHLAHGDYLGACVSVPATQLQTAYCGRINMSLSDNIACDAVPGASSYEFRFEFFNTGQVYTYSSSSNTIVLSAVPGLAVVPGLAEGTTYRVTVRAFIGQQAGAFGSMCMINLRRNNESMTQSLQERRSNQLYSAYITIQLTNNAVIPTINSSQQILGTTAIAPAYAALKTVFDNAVTAAGGNPAQVLFSRVNIDDVLPYPVTREIFEVRFPVMLNLNTLLPQLRSASGMRYANPPFNTMLTGIPNNDPGSGPIPNWHINKLQAPEAWIFMQGVPFQTVGIFESGGGPFAGGRASLTHPELAGRILNGPYPVAEFSNHATAVASIVSANPNGLGPVTVGNTTTMVTSYTLAMGNYFGEIAAFLSSNVQSGTHPRFFNCSFVFVSSVFDLSFSQWFTIYAPWSNVAALMAPFTAMITNDNVMIFASSGNSMAQAPDPLRMRGIGYPFGLPGVIGVGATLPISSPCGEVANGSGDVLNFFPSSGAGWNYNYDDPLNTDPVDMLRDNDGYLDITAPGSFLDVSLFDNPGPSDFNGGSAGTSFSSPMVATVAASMAAVNTQPTFTNTDIERILYETSDKPNYNPNGMTIAQLNGATTACTGYRFNNGGAFTNINMDPTMGYGRVNMLSAVMNAAGLNPGGYTVNNALPFNNVTVNDVNDHVYLYSGIGVGNFNEAWEYDAVLNQNNALVNFDGGGNLATTVEFELAGNASFRISNGGNMNIVQQARLTLNPAGTNPGQGTRLVLENNGTITLNDRIADIPQGGLVEIQSGGTLNLGANAGLNVLSGGTLVIRNGANLNLVNNAVINVQAGGFICIENGANILLQDPASVITLNPGSFSGTFAQLLIQTNCICPATAPFTGLGQIIGNNGFIYGFETQPGGSNAVRADAQTGAYAQLISPFAPAAFSQTNGNSTFDPVNKHLYNSAFDFNSFSWAHMDVDVTTGSNTVTPTPNAYGEYEYDVNTNLIYAINFSASPKELIAIDPATGAYQFTIAQFPNLLNPNFSSSAFDPTPGNSRYFFSGLNNSFAQEHYEININSLAVNITPVASAVSEYRYDQTDGFLYGWENGTHSIVQVNSSSGAITSTIVNLPNLINPYVGTVTYDQGNHRYIIAGPDLVLSNAHYVIDVLTGNVTATSTNANAFVIGDYQFDPCPVFCGTCRFGHSDPQQQNQPAAVQPAPEGLFISNAPNPFSSSTLFSLSLSKAMPVTLEIYNAAGARVASPLVNQYYEAGGHQFEWQPGDLPSGIYYYKLTTPEKQLVQKLVLVR